MPGIATPFDADDDDDDRDDAQEVTNNNGAIALTTQPQDSAAAAGVGAMKEAAAVAANSTTGVAKASPDCTVVSVVKPCEKKTKAAECSRRSGKGVVALSVADAPVEGKSAFSVD